MDPIPAKVVESPSRTVVIDTKYTPLSSIMQYVEGSSWIVNYYSQRLVTNSELGAQQLDVAAVYQQYKLIERMELKVTGAIQSEQDDESKGMTISGTATTYGGFIPNKGDMFLADIGDGREAVFALTNATKKSHMKDAVYVIEYDLVSYTDAAYREDLARKTVEKVIYVKDFLHFGQNPQVLSTDYASLQEFKQLYNELLGGYFHDFFSHEHKTLLIPGQTKTSYDPYLTRALLDWVSTDEHPYVSKIRLPNVDGDPAMKQLTIWDCLGRMAINQLPMALQQVRLLDTSWFRDAPQLAGIYYTGIGQVVYPFDDRTDVDAVHADCYVAPTVEGTTALAKAGRRTNDLGRLLPSSTLNGFDYTLPVVDQLPDVVRVTDDAFYVLSENFYRGITPLRSTLERLVLQGLRQEPLDKVALTRLTKTAMRWENLERFYYIPVLFALLKVAIRTN